MDNSLSNSDNSTEVIKSGGDLFTTSSLKFKITIVLIVVFILNCIGCLFVWQLYNSKSKELESLKKQINLQQSISETNAKLDDMFKREKDLYPQLVATKNELAANNIKLADIQKAIKLTRKDVIDAEVNKMDLNSISNYLSSRGYPNTIIRH
jgi:septal ring factor EnvC (AmiA/AmiB activator)